MEWLHASRFSPAAKQQKLIVFDRSAQKQRKMEKLLFHFVPMNATSPSLERVMPVWTHKGFFRKTGKHINIKSALD